MEAVNYYQSNKPTMSMPYKIGIFLLDFLGIPATILGIAYNWGDIKGYVLTALSLLFICVRFVFYIDDKLAARKSRKIDRELKELELKEQQRKFNKTKN